MQVGNLDMTVRQFYEELKKNESDMAEKYEQAVAKRKQFESIVNVKGEGVKFIFNNYKFYKPFSKKKEIKNKVGAIRYACKHMIGEFTSSDISKFLEENPPPEEIGDIDDSYISAQLGLLKKKGLLEFVKMGEGKGGPKVYAFIGDKE